MILTAKFTEAMHILEANFVVNIPVGFDDGYAKGEADGYEKGHTDGLADGIEQGKQAEYDRFWDIYQDRGNSLDYANRFYGAGWTDQTYNPKYTINGRGKNCLGALACSQITDTKVHIDVSAAKSVKQLFYKCEKLRSIRVLVVSEQTPELINAFRCCYALRYIEIRGTISHSIDFHDSPNLQTNCYNYIIRSLKDLTGATSQTLTFHATVGGKLTQAQKDAISAKNWTLVY